MSRSPFSCQLSKFFQYSSARKLCAGSLCNCDRARFFASLFFLSRRSSVRWSAIPYLFILADQVNVDGDGHVIWIGRSLGRCRRVRRQVDSLGMLRRRHFLSLHFLSLHLRPVAIVVNQFFCKLQRMRMERKTSEFIDENDMHKFRNVSK